MKVFVAFVCLVAAVNCQLSELEWDYVAHGTDWPGNLAFDNTCDGLAQSPIDINLLSARLTNVPGIRQSGATIENRDIDYISAAVIGPGRSIAKRGDVTPDDQVRVSVNGLGFDPILVTGATLAEAWVLQGFEFHGPSEHTFDGMRFPLEVQYILQADFGPFAAISYVFRTTGFSAPFIATLAEAIRNDADTAALTAGLPITTGRFYHYRGSFTSPPCDENVDWVVYQSAIPITSEDLETITGAMASFNWRVTQDLNGRLIGVSDGCGLGGNHFAFSGSRACQQGHGSSHGGSHGEHGPPPSHGEHGPHHSSEHGSHHHYRSIEGWEATPYAPHLRTQERIVNTLYSQPELRKTAEVFADILDYNKRAVVTDSEVEGHYQYTKSFPDIKNKALQAHVEELGGVFARATIDMESIELSHYDVDSTLDRFAYAPISADSPKDTPVVEDSPAVDPNDTSGLSFK